MRGLRIELLSLQDNLQQVRERIERAAASSHRKTEDITLIAVTKVFPVSAIHEAYALGLREFGENYVQEFEGKFPFVQNIKQDSRFHLIGHLQSNKARKVSEMFQVVQTVDSAKLARRLDACGTKLDVMIEVKLSDEEAKHGAVPEELSEVVDTIQTCANLHLTGLMTMPPWSEDAEVARPYFAQLRELAGRFNLARLSMGMSNDLEVAIAEGATHVRIGTALFGKRKKP